MSDGNFARGKNHGAFRLKIFALLSSVFEFTVYFYL